MPEDKKPTESTDDNTSLEPTPDSQGNGSTSLDSSSDNGQPLASIDPTANNNESGDIKKPGGLKAFFHKINLYLLIFVLLVLIGAVVVAVSYLNSKKEPTKPSIAGQSLTQDQLKQLANSNSTVGSSGQTLTIQGNAIINGQELVKGDLDVAGNLKLGGNVVAQDITASGQTNLKQTQIQKLQVANGLIVKGDVTMQNNLNVAGSSSFKGTITAGTINARSIILSGNAELKVPNHISFTGATPTVVSVNRTVLGGAGSASISGSDASGTINVNTGTGTRAGCFVTVRFSQPFTSNPRVQLTPIDQGAGQTNYYVTRSTSQMSICTANAPPAHSRFAFDYFIAG